MKIESPKLKIIDNLIFFFFFLFLGSLTVSIFINQIGYYGALLLILMRYFLTKENPFRRSGLEIAILLFMLAEILSTIFSLDPAHSFHNLLKRFLLLPVLYFTAAYVNDENKLKKIVNLYMFFGLLACMYYVYAAKDYFIYGLFFSSGSGPSVFQFQITAGEIYSFLVITFFAFFMQESNNRKLKLYYLLGTSVSALALFATFKRTGWMGTLAGIIAILVYKKKWGYLTAAGILIFTFLIFQENLSKVSFYKIENQKVRITNEKPTDGLAHNLFIDDNNTVVADYDNGVVKYDSSSEQTGRLQLDGAVINVKIWKNKILTLLTDSRFFIFNKMPDGKYQKEKMFLSPGDVVSFEIFNDLLYVNDYDSGLTIYSNPANISEFKRYPHISHNEKVRVDSNYLFCFTSDNGSILYKIKDGFPDDRLNISTEVLQDYQFVDYNHGKIFASNANRLDMYSVEKNQIKKKFEISEIKNVYYMSIQDSVGLFLTRDKKLILSTKKADKGYMLVDEITLENLPNNIYLNHGVAVSTFYKQSRILSIFDSHKKTNFTRFAFWRAGIEIFKDYPIFGVGDIDLKQLYIEYKRPQDKELQGHLHSNYFQIIAILGGFGFCVLIYLFIRILKINIEVYKKVKDNILFSSISLTSIGVFFAFLVSGLTEWNFGDHEIITMLWFITGLNLAVKKLNEND